MAPPVFFSRGKLVFGARRRGSSRKLGFRAVSLGVAGEEPYPLFLRRRRGRAGSWRRCEAPFGRLRPLELGSHSAGDGGVLQCGVLVEYTRPSLEESALSSTDDEEEEGGGGYPTCHANVAPSLHTPTMQHGTCTMVNARMVAPWLAFHLPFPPSKGALSRWQMARKVAHSALG